MLNVTELWKCGVMFIFFCMCVYVYACMFVYVCTYRKSSEKQHVDYGFLLGKCWILSGLHMKKSSLCALQFVLVL